MLIFLPRIFHGHGGKSSQSFFCLIKNCEHFKAKIQSRIASLVTVEDFWKPLLEVLTTYMHTSIETI